MRPRARLSRALLEYQKERSERRKIATRLSHAIRLGAVTVRGGSVHELDGDHRCNQCNAKGRVFWVSSFFATSDDGKLGFIRQTPYVCAVCFWQRYQGGTSEQADT